ncbi:MAG TPA: hypothetical protein VGO86_04490 [Candidatus Dormibacteraeota bacterium]
MIQTPPSARNQSDLSTYLILAGLWIVPGIVIVVATVLAGGAPHTHLFEWPYTAIRSVSQGHGRVAPWQWVGAPGVRSTVLFWVVVVMVLVPGFAGFLIGAVALRGGIPAFFPFLSQPRMRSRWARAQALARSGLAIPAPDGRRLVLGRHRGRLVAVRDGTSVLALGLPGSGKSAALCIPAIGDWDGPVVAVSDGTDLIEGAAGVRQHLGRVDVLDLTRRTGLGSCTWTPSGVSLTFDEAVALVSQVLGSRDPSPDEQTQQVLTCALYAAANRGLGVAAAVEWLDDLTGATLVRALLQVEDRDPRATSWATRMVELDRDQRAACFSAARQLLRAHFEQAGPGASRAFQPAEFLAGAANTLFVVARPATLSASSAVEALLRALVRGAERSGRRPLLLVLDGCAAVGAMPDLAEHLAARSDAVTVLAALRDLNTCGASLDWDMGAVAEDAGAVMFLGGGAGGMLAADSGAAAREPASTAELMHRLVRRQLARRRRAPWGDRQPDLLPPEAARQLGYGRALLVHDRMAPAVLWTRSCYEDPELQRRHREHPFVRGVARIHEAS